MSGIGDQTTGDRIHDVIDPPKGRPNISELKSGGKEQGVFCVYRNNVCILEEFHAMGDTCSHEPCNMERLEAPIK